MITLLKKTYTSLTKTRGKINNLFASFAGKSFLDDNDIELFEETLLNADIGWELTDYILAELKNADLKEIKIDQRVYNCINKYLDEINAPKDLKKIIMLVGINGTGKTTSAAKLGGYYTNLGDSVSLVAADTYRAAAVEQLQIWVKKLKLEFTYNARSSDPASIAYDGVASGLSRKLDRIIIDTSGRVHNSINLMKELEKIYKVIYKQSKEVDVLMTIDANTGQNAILQAQEYLKYIPVSGIILTKMDGTARGGIAIQIIKKLKLQVYFLGTGEKVDDLVPFHKDNYIKSLITS